MSSELDEKDKRVLQYIQDQPGEFAGTPEVADVLGLTTNGAAYRLKKLQELGLVKSRQPSRDEIWYLEGPKHVRADGEHLSERLTIPDQPDHVGLPGLYRAVKERIRGLRGKIGAPSEGHDGL